MDPFHPHVNIGTIQYCQYYFLWRRHILMMVSYETISHDSFMKCLSFIKTVSIDPKFGSKFWSQTSLRLPEFGLLCWIEKSRVEIMKCNIWISDIYFSSCLFSTRLHSSLLSGDYFQAINSYCRRVKWSNFDAYYMQHIYAKISKNVYHWKLGNFLRFYRQYPVTLCQNKIKFYLNFVNGWYLDLKFYVKFYILGHRIQIESEFK